MTGLDVPALFSDGEPAPLALLSTYTFDPDFFENRLLRGGALGHARRTAVFVDDRQWRGLCRRDIRAAGANRRYLVVPVRSPAGVFHPKLSLLLSDNGGRVTCGSGNLTRAGFTSNLELFNTVPFRWGGDDPAGPAVAADALAFFRRAAEEAAGEAGWIVGEWIEEAEREFADGLRSHTGDGGRVRLAHTYAGPLWERLESEAGDAPQQFLVLSPFHDAGGDIARRLCDRWPGADVEFVVQQHYTDLQPAVVKDLPAARLSKLSAGGRRTHAKLIAWRGGAGSGCLAGSANFTTAAFGGRNVEAVFALRGCVRRLAESVSGW